MTVIMTNTMIMNDEWEITNILYNDVYLTMHFRFLNLNNVK